MASCSLCLGNNKKLYKGMYYEYRIYVCKQCAITNYVELEKELA